jgi:hypothetical protein
MRANLVGAAIGGAVGAADFWMAYDVACERGTSGVLRAGCRPAVSVAIILGGVAGAVIAPRLRSKGGVAGMALVSGFYVALSDLAGGLHQRC